MKKTENRTETAVFKKPKPKTEPTEKKPTKKPKTETDLKNRNRPTTTVHTSSASAHRHSVYCFLIRPTEPRSDNLFSPATPKEQWPLANDTRFLYITTHNVGDAHAGVYIYV
jgi:hypothetical protein